MSIGVVETGGDGVVGVEVVSVPVVSVAVGSDVALAEIESGGTLKTTIGPCFWTWTVDGLAVMPALASVARTGVRPTWTCTFTLR